MLKLAQGGGEMIQLGKVLLSLSSICGTHVLEGENRLPEVVSSHIHNLILLLCVLFGCCCSFKDSSLKQGKTEVGESGMQLKVSGACWTCVRCWISSPEPAKKKK